MRALLCIDQREAVEALIQELPKFMLKAVPTDCSECPICLEEFRVGNEVRGLPCAHNFHVECIDQWLRLNVKCPRCRCSVFPNLNLSALSNLRTSDILSYSNSANQVTTTVSSTQYVLSQQPPGQNYLLRLQGLLRPVIRSKLPDVAASPVENGLHTVVVIPEESPARTVAVPDRLPDN